MIISVNFDKIKSEKEERIVRFVIQLVDLINVYLILDNTFKESEK